MGRVSVRGQSVADAIQRDWHHPRTRTHTHTYIHTHKHTQILTSTQTNCICLEALFGKQVAER